MSVVRVAVLGLLIFLFLGGASLFQVRAQDAGIDLTITVDSQKSSYYYREPMKFSGDFKQNGLLVSNGTVGIAVYEAVEPALPIAFRALKTGQFVGNYPINVVELIPSNQSGGPVNSYLPGQTMWLKITLQNTDTVDHYQITSITIFDANGIPLATRFASTGIVLAGTSPTTFFMGPDIPVWAQPGNATLIACVFSADPKDGGVPYCEEKKVYFEIKRNPQLQYTTAPMTDPAAPSGSFASSLKFLKEMVPGDYAVYVSARSTVVNDTSGQQSPLTVQNATVFSVLNAIMPPQAAFTYYPVESFVNMSITFDASASTAEGYNVTLVKYEWDFGNGTKFSRTTPTITNVFTQAGNYTVTLNVTDSQGLWSTTSKIVSILPPVGPTADFIWSPPIPTNATPVLFDASSTILGWNGTAHPPIVNYIWDFGDGNVTSGNYVTITHKYASDGNYTVKLNVTDASGYKGYVSKLVQVRLGGVAGDINGDGKVDIYDAILLANAFNTRPGDLRWNPNADINQDDVVDIFDAIILASNFGKTG